MDGYSIALVLIALMIGIGCLLMMGYYKRYDFNYKLGQTLELGFSVYASSKMYSRILLRCVFFPLFGWLWLIGWWWAEEYGLKEGKASIGEMEKPKPVKNDVSG